MTILTVPQGVNTPYQLDLDGTPVPFFLPLTDVTHNRVSLKVPIIETWRAAVRKSDSSSRELWVQIPEQVIALPEATPIWMTRVPNGIIVRVADEAPLILGWERDGYNPSAPQVRVGEVLLSAQFSSEMKIPQFQGERPYLWLPSDWINFWFNQRAYVARAALLQ